MSHLPVRRTVGVALTAALIGAGAFALPAQADTSHHGDPGWGGGNNNWGGGNWWDESDSSITGTVTDSSGDAVEGAQVVAYDATDSEMDQPVAYADTDEDGTYELDLSEGSYVVGFVAPGADQATVYWKGATDVDDATVVDVADGDTVDGIDATLPDTGEIDGTVTDAAGDGLDRVSVVSYTYDSDASRWVRGDSTRTDDDGSYTLDGLTDGTYRLKFVDSRHQYPTEYYDDVSTLSAAKDIVISDADDVTDIDAQLSRASFSASPAPTISGDAVVGQTLTAVAGTWAPTPDSLTYQWYADGKAVRHGKASTLAVTEAMVGEAITVKVTGHKRFYKPVAETSDPTADVLEAAATTSTPTVTGSAVTGGTLTAKVTGVSPARARLSYQWYADGAAIKGATSSTYAVTSKVSGKRLSVKVVAMASGLTSLAHTSARTIKVR